MPASQRDDAVAPWARGIEPALNRRDSAVQILGYHPSRRCPRAAAVEDPGVLWNLDAE